MAVLLTIQGIDRTARVQWQSLRIENILTQQVDRCTFKIWSYGDRAFVPAIGREVIITDGSTRVFGGIIVRQEAQVLNYPNVQYSIECMDYTRLLDQHLVAETYENMTINAIIADIVNNWAPAGILNTNVDEPTVLSYIQFNYEPVSHCLKQLADAVGADWYIDYYKTLYFKQPSASAAPIDITDSGGVYDKDSLVIRKDTSQLRNSIVVRGGEYLGTQFTASMNADGKRITYELPYGFDDFKIRVNGVNKTVGIDNIDDPASFDVLYNFSEKIVKFKTSNLPALNSTLSFSGKPHLPVIVKLKDQGKINAIYSAESSLGDGRYEYLVVDKSINSKAGARERALAEIRSYGESLVEGEFSTETSGLVAGQQILVNSTVMGVNEYYIISRVISTMKTTTAMQYKISLISTKTMDFISVIKKLLLSETKKIEIKQGEVTDLVEAADETITFTESLSSSLSHNPQTETISFGEAFTAQALNYAVTFRYGPLAPTGTQRIFVLDGSRLA